MKLLKSREDVDELLRRPRAIVFKHSTACSISDRAHREAEEFLAAHPEEEIHKVHVIEDRAVSDYIQETTGVRHESPQILVFRNGNLVWHDSHGAVTAEAIASHLT